MLPSFMQLNAASSEHETLADWTIMVLMLFGTIHLALMVSATLIIFVS